VLSKKKIQNPKARLNEVKRSIHFLLSRSLLRRTPLRFASLLIKKKNPKKNYHNTPHILNTDPESKPLFSVHPETSPHRIRLLIYISSMRKTSLPHGQPQINIPPKVHERAKCSPPLSRYETETDHTSRRPHHHPGHL